ncbi:alpha/beta fold hydrolase [Thermoleophilia bacterium SCSIO 60948]|nr:alpha/beta fold hydrolase [Thermoleophilia bacterium SCSIO 60948]
MSERVDGLAYDVTGDGPPLLLIHAGIAERRAWDPVLGRLSDRFRVIRYDGRGFGESDDPTAPWYLHEDAARLIEAVAGGPARVIGNSLGGSVAIDLALERPDLVERFVTVGSRPDGLDEDPWMLARFEEVDALFEAGDVEAANEREMEIWMDGTRAPGACDAAVRDVVSRINVELLRRQADLPEPLELEPAAFFRLANLEPPLLVCVGEYDQPSVAEGSRLLADRTGSRLVELPGSAHVPALETPDVFCDAVLPFLDGAIA